MSIKIENISKNLIAIMLVQALIACTATKAHPGTVESKKHELAKQVLDQIDPEALFEGYSRNVKSGSKTETDRATFAMRAEYNSAVEKAFDPTRMAKLYRDKFEAIALEEDLQAEIDFYKTELGRKSRAVLGEVKNNPDAFVAFVKELNGSGISAKRREFVLQYNEIVKATENAVGAELSAERTILKGMESVGYDVSIIKHIEKQLKIAEEKKANGIRDRVLTNLAFFLSHFNDDEVDSILRSERTPESRRLTAASQKAYRYAIEEASMDFGMLIHTYKTTNPVNASSK